MEKSLQRLLVETYPNSIEEQSLALAAIIRAKQTGNASTLNYYNGKFGANVEELVTPLQVRWFETMMNGFMTYAEHDTQK